MMSEEQLSILRIVAQKLLIKKRELAFVSKEIVNGSLESCIESLKNSGYIDIVAPMGETSLAITQKGMRLVSGEKEQGTELRN